MAGNRSLTEAAKAKEDEFYTQLTDIEKELRHYRKHFKGKTVFCNCDDPFESNFFKYFVLNFNKLGLKKLIATCYGTSPIANQQISLFDILGGDEANKTKPYKAVVTKVYDATGDGGIDMLDVAELFKTGENELTELEGDGDFRSKECIKLLKEADIVVTNPPFSLFREYVSVLVRYDKDFLIIGNQNAITYKEIFPLLKENKMWLGYKAGDMAFTVPDYYKPRETRYWEDEDGQKWRSLGNICWYTNLDIKKRHEDMILIKKYNPEEYPKYDNYDAIEVSKVKDIPYNYDGIMGVPITFMDKYNPDQFEIVGIDFQVKDGLLNQIVKEGWDGKLDRGYINGQRKYSRMLIRNKHPEPRKEE
ncbi:adenine-specific methyltransferase EcoRI family protein [Varibaculum cambriense]|uniref:adenine-specific methyltransferase EcoRI family protein n=1 Tax=Varibaculum cambriense TaxID=184870 RepID=UPI00255443FE|nr:adenine-specific methyltransferase EcoRI family protein [Varibaculum cambriense]MDK8275385.1 adenine-specific methyltransferase EcoRI family protein [Varibaculum cambriense]